MAGCDIRITLQRFNENARNEFNEPTSAWEVLATVWASKVDQPLAEIDRAAATQTGGRAVFRVRSNGITRGLTSRDRLVLSDDRVWNIVSVRDADAGRRRTVEIVAMIEGQGVL